MGNFYLNTFSTEAFAEKSFSRSKTSAWNINVLENLVSEDNHACIHSMLDRILKSPKTDIMNKPVKHLMKNVFLPLVHLAK